MHWNDTLKHYNSIIIASSKLTWICEQFRFRTLYTKSNQNQTVLQTTWQNCLSYCFIGTWYWNCHKTRLSSFTRHCWGELGNDNYRVVTNILSNIMLLLLITTTTIIIITGNIVINLTKSSFCCQNQQLSRVVSRYAQKTAWYSQWNWSRERFNVPPNGDVTKFKFDFHDVWTSNVFIRFEIRRMFLALRCRMRIRGKSLFYDWFRMHRQPASADKQVLFLKFNLSHKLQ